MKVSILALLFLANVTSSVYGQTDFAIKIDRSSYSDECIQGYMFVNSEAICYTLELPWADNQNNISAIPVGKYSGFLRYDKSDGWRIQLENVPNRPGVQIHVGNYTSQTKGCVLVDDGVGDCTVSSSKNAYNKLKVAFYGSENPVQTPDKIITVEIVD
ncbi:MAG: hypothetical protein JKY54_18000 [Flavobacteriales bacterium]|nr:hypothetical protein [Flavobacteriales bacterium]